MERINLMICPACGKSYTDKPALSRADNVTLICPDCGTKQALDSIGVSVDERDAIIKIINKHKK